MKTITAVVIGAGLRGADAYASYALEYPHELKIVGVAEPDKARREAMAKKHGLTPEQVFEDYQALLDRPLMADCAFVCTQDRMHYVPVAMALEKGYHVLCEKPMSPDKNEIIDMGKLAKKYDRILSICHVLRYSAFFGTVKKLLAEGRIGKLRTITHIEEVGHWHQAHSFVRGNWRNSDETSPMILAKCCHDMDILSWLTESPCRTISSFGGLSYFNREYAPEGAPDYCMDGCMHRESCPYYAPRFYLEHPRAVEDDLVKAVTEKMSRDDLLAALQRGPYGRCVFKCDNNVVDHQITNIEFENHVLATLTMSGFTQDCKREIRLMGTAGELVGDMEKGEIIVRDFVTRRTDQISLRTTTKGHRGSDHRMIRAFLAQLRSAADAGAIRTDADISVESHLMALAAEKSRVEGRTIDFKTFKDQQEPRTVE